MELTRYFESRDIDLMELAPHVRVPRRFTDLASEHLATRRSAGLFDFSFMACVQIRGRDAVTLLQEVQTRHISDVALGRIRYTLLLREDGTVLNDATLWRTAPDAWLLFVGRHDDLAHVFTRASSLDVELDDRSGSLAVLALQGPRAHAMLARVMRVPDALPYFAFTDADFAGRRCLVARIGYTGEFGYELVIGADRGAGLWQALRAAHEVTECGFEAANTLRIEAGYILFSNELTLPVTPAELGLARLVETRRIARTPERQLVGLVFDSSFRRQAGIQANGTTASAVAWVPTSRRHDVMVTSVCHSPLLDRWIGLAFVPAEQRYPRTRVSVDGTRATVTRLPFYSASNKTRSRS